MKKCKTCGSEKPLSEYYFKKESKDKLGYECKECHLNRVRDYRKTNPEKIKGTNKKSYLSNRSERLSRQKEYYQENVSKVSAYKKEWHKKNPNYGRMYDLKKKYNLTMEDIDQMLMSQDNKCCTCKNKFSEDLKIAVDHCHTHGQVRGLLCTKCNIALGLVMDNISTLKEMIKYLKTNAKDI